PVYCRRRREKKTLTGRKIVSDTILRNEKWCLTRSAPERLLEPSIRERVRAFVLDVAGVAAHPVPAHVMALRQRIELHPEVLILHRLLVRGAPAALDPLRQPFGHALLHVRRIGIELHAARLLQRLERADRRGQLHPIVRRQRLAAAKLLDVPAMTQHDAPPARPGVAAASPVRDRLDFLHSLSGFFWIRATCCETRVEGSSPPTALRRGWRHIGLIGVNG